MKRRAGCLCVLLGLVVTGEAGAFIHKIYPLRDVINESTHILVGRLQKVDAQHRTAVAVVRRALKGKAEFKTVLMNIAVGPAHHAEYVIERLSPGADFILFYKRNGTNLASLVHAGDTWFQLFATDNRRARDKVWWRMTHVEIYLGRTYNGTTPDLVKLIGDIVAKGAKPPAPDASVPQLNLAARARRVRVPVPKGKSDGFFRQVQFRHNGGSEIRGISWADVNGDDLFDVLLCRQKGNVLLMNQPSGFRDATSQFGLAGGSRSAAWADYDGDGHPDLVTSNFQLFTNVGGRMRNDSKLLTAPRSRNPEGAGWIDYNGDGRPDVLIANASGLRLYENTGRKGAERFRDVSDRAGLGARGVGVGNGDYLACLDYDGDGYTDFFYNLGHGVLAHNEGNGTFKRDTGSGIRLAGGSGYKRGLAVADFDNDGDLDLFVPGPRKAQLYRNNNDGTFTDVIASGGDLAKVASPSFAAAWGDVNCDGRLDLFVCHPASSARLYLGDGRGRFVDVSGAVGVNGANRACAASFADVDSDGDLDLCVNLPDRIVLALNEMKRPPGRAPVTVRAYSWRGTIGAVVRVTDRGGRLLGMRELNGAAGCGGQAWPVAHFGVPVGTCRVSMCLTDGRAAEKLVTVDSGRKGAQVTFGDDEFW